MKRIVSTVLAALGAFGALAFAASYAQAQHHHHHRARVGVYIGAPLFISPWPYYRPYYHDPYYYRPVVIREQPVVYVEQQPSYAPAPAPVAPPAPQALPQQQYWYFCQDTQTYYPHVQNCATPWQRVIPHATR
ncbi:MAG: hypothetical protein ABL891_17010 [Burkholderiales bacterium]